jgi:phosphohistidine phosphatase
MKIYLIRHAKTEPSSTSGKDFDRVLMPRGKRQAQDLAGYLKTKKISVEKILCSSSIRTRETHSLLDLEATVEFLGALYLASHQDMLRIINLQPIKGDLILVGHNEGISNLASYLTGKDIYMQTAMLMALKFNGNNWRELSGETATIYQTYRSSTD